MHHYTATILTACAAFAAIWVIHEFIAHRQRKADQRKAAAHEAIMTRAIERAFISASRQRAAERLQAQQQAAHRAMLESIEEQHQNRAASLIGKTNRRAVFD
jgi:preprotein translocase subunit YajC